MQTNCFLVAIFAVTMAKAYISIDGSAYELSKDPVPEVEVGVFYESLCPDSIKFFKEQLYSTYQKLGKYFMDGMPILMPYGKTKITGRDSRGKLAFSSIYCYLL